MAHSEDPFYLVRADVLPEAIQKTIEAKRMLETGEAHTVQEAVEKAGISRSSFYKYRDSVFPFNAMMKEKIITLSLTLEHRSGVLSSVLGYLASLGCNVLTIHQTIPLQGDGQCGSLRGHGSGDEKGDGDHRRPSGASGRPVGDSGRLRRVNEAGQEG